MAYCSPNGGEIFVAPEFVDAGADDYRLQITSPAVDAADPAFPDDGSLPPGVGSISADMGAYGGPHGIWQPAWDRLGWTEWTPTP